MVGVKQIMNNYSIRYNITQPSFSQEYLSPSSDIQTCIEKVKVYIETHLHEPLSLNELASSGGFSIYYFARRFKQSTGLSPKQYVLRKRLEYAYLLLGRGHTTVSEVAHQTGFTDQSHLVRYFKKCWGQTPREVLDAEAVPPLTATEFNATQYTEEILPSTAIPQQTIVVSVPDQQPKHLLFLA
jgi:AraC-like DNA-binding protein